MPSQTWPTAWGCVLVWSTSPSAPGCSDPSEVSQRTWLHRGDEISPWALRLRLWRVLGGGSAWSASSGAPPGTPRHIQLRWPSAVAHCSMHSVQSRLQRLLRPCGFNSLGSGCAARVGPWLAGGPESVSAHARAVEWGGGRRWRAHFYGAPAADERCDPSFARNSHRNDLGDPKLRGIWGAAGVRPASPSR